jgi:hypothetical protein
MADYLTILATLSGAGIGGIIGFTSAYLLQRQRFKRENVLEMREKIYGPIFMKISKLLETTKLFDDFGLDGVWGLKQTSDHYLFSNVGKDLKNKLTALSDRLETYQRVKRGAEVVFDDVAKEEVKKASNLQRGDDSSTVWLRSLIGKTMANAISLKEAVFRELAPRDFVAIEKEKWGNDITFEATNVGKLGNLGDFVSLYTLLVDRMKTEPLYVAEKEQRMRLIHELESFSEQISGFINLHK